MSKIVVVFPGVGYTVDKPLLYYGLDVAYEAGYCEIVKIAYSSENKGDIRNNIEVRKNLYEDLYCQAQLQLSEKANVPIHVFDGCNHSLETEDALKNIEIIEKTMKITKGFIGNE